MAMGKKASFRILHKCVISVENCHKMTIFLVVHTHIYKCLKMSRRVHIKVIAVATGISRGCTVLKFVIKKYYSLALSLYFAHFIRHLPKK